MRISKRMGTIYELDSDGFLLNPKKWEPELAEGLALELGIQGGLTKEHWDVIYFIRGQVQKTGKCPNIFETCRANNLRRNELKRLFPTGYMRGACLLAGISYKDAYLGPDYMEYSAKDLQLAGISYKDAYLGPDYMEHSAKDLHAVAQRQEYRVDVRGFLIDPDEWDEHYAAHRAYEMKIAGGKLEKMHWQIIRYLRSAFYKTGKIPTAIDACDANGIDIDELEKLFPDGYHRGAVKLAGLRLR